MENVNGYFIAYIVCKNAMVFEYSGLLENFDTCICTNKNKLDKPWISSPRFIMSLVRFVFFLVVGVLKD